MKSVLFAMIAAMLTLPFAAQANSVNAQDALSVEVAGNTALLRGEIGGWLSSCRYTRPEPFGPVMERVDWGDGSASVPEDFDTVSCGNMARHVYKTRGDFEIVVTRSQVDAGNGKPVLTEQIKTKATILPEITAELAEDGSVRIGGQIGDWIALCDYPRNGRAFMKLTVRWGDGTSGSACPETLSHRYAKPGRYDIFVDVVAPGPTDGAVFSTSRTHVVIPE